MPLPTSTTCGAGARRAGRVGRLDRAAAARPSRRRRRARRRSRCSASSASSQHRARSGPAASRGLDGLLGEPGRGLDRWRACWRGRAPSQLAPAPRDRAGPAGPSSARSPASAPARRERGRRAAGRRDAGEKPIGAEQPAPSTKAARASSVAERGDEVATASASVRRRARAAPARRRSRGGPRADADEEHRLRSARRSGDRSSATSPVGRRPERAGSRGRGQVVGELGGTGPRVGAVQSGHRRRRVPGRRPPRPRRARAGEVAEGDGR